jgi:hypothetical protein
MHSVITTYSISLLPTLPPLSPFCKREGRRMIWRDDISLWFCVQCGYQLSPDGEEVVAPATTTPPISETEEQRELEVAKIKEILSKGGYCVKDPNSKLGVNNWITLKEADGAKYERRLKKLTGPSIATKQSRQQQQQFIFESADHYTNENSLPPPSPDLSSSSSIQPPQYLQQKPLEKKEGSDNIFIAPLTKRRTDESRYQKKPKEFGARDPELQQLEDRGYKVKDDHEYLPNTNDAFISKDANFHNSKNGRSW